MSLGHGAKIVTDGLILCLDAANPKSYPGAGTTWYDISGNNAHGTMIGTAALIPDNLGTIFLDGSANYIDIPNIPGLAGLATITIEAVINLKAAAGMFLGFTSYDVWTNSGHLGYNNGASNIIGINAAEVTTQGLIGDYVHYVFTMNSSGLLSTNKIHINGVDQGLLTPQLASDGSCKAFTSNMKIGSWNSLGYYGDLNCSLFKMYNRGLTDDEIKQNLNAVRGRFGI